MRILLAVLALPPAVAAHAAPVTLDFRGGVGSTDDFRATYVEEGFVVEAFGFYGGENGIQRGLREFTDVFSGGDPLTTEYTLSTVSGRPFDLLAASVGAFNNTRVFYETFFADGSSSFEFVPATRSPALVISGERADGSAVSTAVNLDEAPRGPSGVDLSGLGLTGLDAVDLRLGFAGNGRFACDPQTLALRSDPSVGVPLFCGLDATLREDVVEIDAFSTADPSNFFIIGFAAGFTVAPVPLPAALPLLAGGLGALAWLRRRR